MSDYAYVADKASKAFASVSRLEDALSKSPDDPALQLNLRSMRHRAAQALLEMERLAALNSIEICRYRIMPADGHEYMLEHVSSSLLNYQLLFTQIYDSHKNGRKDRGKVGAETKKESALNFGFSYSGSLGVALLVRSDRGFFEGNLDKSIETVYQILDLETVDEVREVSNILGRAVVKRVHDWAASNIAGMFAADIQWKRSDGRYLGKVVDIRDLANLVTIIDSTSDRKTYPVKVTGMLIGGNVSSRTFQFHVSESETYVGHIADDADLPDLTLGHYYEAIIDVSEVYYYATEKTEKTNMLKKLTTIT